MSNCLPWSLSDKENHKLLIWWVWIANQNISETQFRLFHIWAYIVYLFSIGLFCSIPINTKNKLTLSLLYSNWQNHMTNIALKIALTSKTSVVTATCVSLSPPCPPFTERGKNHHHPHHHRHWERPSAYSSLQQADMNKHCLLLLQQPHLEIKVQFRTSGGSLWWRN